MSFMTIKSRPVHVVCRRFVAESSVSLLSEQGIRLQKLIHSVKNIPIAAERVSEWLCYNVTLSAVS